VRQDRRGIIRRPGAVIAANDPVQRIDFYNEQTAKREQMSEPLVMEIFSDYV